MKPEARSIDILAMLSNGVSSADIIRIKEERREFFQSRLKRGLASEQIVFDVLLGLPIVARVDKIPTQSTGDYNGIDIVVGLTTNIPEAIVGKVRVQVKSSEWGIQKFRRRIKAENSLKDEQIDSWLIKNGWIVLNGQMSPEEIEISFLEQLKKINDFAKITETTASKEDVRNRMRDQARRYLDRLRSGTLTPEWEKWGRKHSFEIAKLVY